MFLILDGKLSVGALVAANMLAGRVLAPIAGIAAVITRATQTITRADARSTALMSLERERPPERTLRVARRSSTAAIAFENVTLQLSRTLHENALEKVSFKIAPGERVGIIGRVGSGKTTVGRLLVGLL